MADLIFEYAKKEDVNEICSLLSKAFSRRFVDLYRKRWDWLIKNPLGGEKTFLIAKIGKKIVGHLTQIPTKVFTKGKSFDSKFTADLIVHPDFRGKGIGAKLLEECRRNTDFIFTMGSSKKASPLEIKQGYSYPYFIPLKIKLLDSSAVVGNNFTRIFLNPMIKFIFSEKQEKRLRITRINKTNISKLDKLFSQEMKNRKAISLRSSDYMKWRFLECDIKDYEIIAAEENNDFIGYLVYRTANFKKRMKKGFIVDCLAVDDREDVLLSLLNYANDELRKKGAVISMGYFNASRSLFNALKKAGYMDSPIKKLDYRFQTTEKSKNDFKNIGIKDFYITNLDGDTDMNNF